MEQFTTTYIINYTTIGGHYHTQFMDMPNANRKTAQNLEKMFARRGYTDVHAHVYDAKYDGPR